MRTLAIFTLLVSGVQMASASVTSQPFGHLLEGTFLPFASSSKTKVEAVTISREQFWKLLTDIDDATDRLEWLDLKGSVKNSPRCTLKLKNLEEMSNQIRDLKEFLLLNCREQKGSEVCSSYRDNWGDLPSVTQNLVTEFAVDCIEKSAADSRNAQNASVGLISSFEKFQSSGNSHVGADSRSIYSGALLGKFEKSFSKFKWNIDSNFAFEEGSLLHDIDSALTYENSGDSLDLRMEQTLQSQSGHWMEPGDDLVTYGKLNLATFVSTPSSKGPAFWELGYRPELSLSTSNTYSELSHRFSLEKGERSIKGDQRNSYYLSFLKSFSTGASILPDTQLVEAGNFQRGSLIGTCRYEIHLGIKEVRDSDFSVRILPKVDFRLFERRGSGLVFEQGLFSLTPKHHHSSELQLVWDVESNFQSALNRFLLVRALHRMYLNDQTHFLFESGWKRHQNISKRIAGTLESSEFWQRFGFQKYFNPNWSFQSELKFAQFTMNDPSETFHSRIWMRPSASTREVQVSAGIVYEF